jgi:hypothetical protein
MDERVLTMQELREEDVRVIRKLRQDSEDETSLRMAPP